MGLIDMEGHVLDIEKAKSKLFIIEQEFANAEKAEEMLKKEEDEVRRRVQQKRLRLIEKGKLKDRLAKMKEDHRIRKEIRAAAQPNYSVQSLSTTSKKSSTKKNNATSFFMTDMAVDAFQGSKTSDELLFDS
eukprot:g1548.t1